MPSVTPAGPEHGRRPAALRSAATTPPLLATVDGRPLGGRAAPPPARSPICADAPPAPRADELLDAPRRLVEQLAHVRASVTAYVGRRRGDGLPVGHIVPEVEALVRVAMPGEELHEAVELLLAYAVRWSVDAYYAPYDATPGWSPDDESGAVGAPPRR